MKSKGPTCEAVRRTARPKAAHSSAAHGVDGNGNGNGAWFVGMADAFPAPAAAVSVRRVVLLRPLDGPLCAVVDAFPESPAMKRCMGASRRHGYTDKNCPATTRQFIQSLKQPVCLERTCPLVTSGKPVTSAAGTVDVARAWK